MDALSDPRAFLSAQDKVGLIIKEMFTYLIDIVAESRAIKSTWHC